MRIVVNGEQRDVEAGATVADLIHAAGLADAPCAAEVNESLVAKSRHAEAVLHEGDKVELVTLVGGG